MQPGHQLGQVERLDQVVVGARVQPADPVLHIIEGGQHEDGSPAAADAQLIADGKPVGVREHHV